MEEAIEQGKLRVGGPPSAEELKEIESSLIPPQFKLFDLINPERDAKTDADYMRISFVKEDAEWLADQKIKTLTQKEQNKLPREVLTDNWEEDMSMYKYKRKP